MTNVGLQRAPGFLWLGTCVTSSPACCALKDMSSSWHRAAAWRAGYEVARRSRHKFTNAVRERSA